MRVVALLTLLTLTPACAAPAERSAASPSVKDEIVKQGYRPAMLNGQLLYCRAEAVTGTQFQGTVCLSEAQFSERERKTRETTQSRAMHPNLQCNPKDCPQ